MKLNNDFKKKVAEAMKSLEQAVLDNDLACMFTFEEELTELTSAEFSMAFVADITKVNEGKGNIVVDVYLSKIFSDGGEQ